MGRRLLFAITPLILCPALLARPLQAQEEATSSGRKPNSRTVRSPAARAPSPAKKGEVNAPKSSPKDPSPKDPSPKDKGKQRDKKKAKDNKGREASQEKVDAKPLKHSDKKQELPHEVARPHHDPMSLSYQGPSQLYDYSQPYIASVFSFNKETNYGMSPTAAFTADSYGPHSQTLLVYRDRGLPFIASLQLGMGRRKGISSIPNRSGPTDFRLDHTGLAITYPLTALLAIALSLDAKSQLIRGTFYRSPYFFAWNEYTISALWHAKLWEVGAQVRPGVLKVGRQNDGNEAVTLAIPPRLDLFATYYLQHRLALFARAEALFQNNLNQRSDQSWANQFTIFFGGSFAMPMATFELAFSIASHGFRDVNQYSAAKLGENGISASVAKPFDDGAAGGLRCEFASGEATMSEDGQRWTFTSNKKSVSIFASWQLAATRH